MSDLGEAYPWDAVIPRPWEQPERVHKLEVIPKPEAKATSWIGDAQALAVLALSAAAQRPDAEALALLETVPREAWGCSPELRDIVDLTTNAIRIGQPEGFMPEVLDSVGDDGDPWALGEYCDRLSKLWVAFHASTRTLPRENPEPEAEKAPALPETDLIKSTQPMYLADNFLDRWHNARPLRRFNSEWYRYTGKGYEVYPDEGLRAALYKHLDGKYYEDEKGEVRPLRVNRQTVSNVLDAMPACDTLVEGDIPQWTDGRDGAGDFLAMENGLLHLPTRTKHLHDPAYFNTTILPYPFNPQAARATRWLAFLESIWPDDRESIDLLQEFFGYLLTGDTRYQKVLMIVGPKRSGKGTIAHTAEAMIGPANCCSPTMAGMAQNFGMASIIGKRLAVFGDARISGRSDTALVVDRLLSLSGGDLQTIPRKHREDWIGLPETRLTILSNEIPQLQDASGALASRMIMLQLKKSFYGHEDHGLKNALQAELTGILNWALDGLDRLTARGRFPELQSSNEAIDTMTALGSPVAAFVGDCCELRAGYFTSSARLYEAFRRWCEGEGFEHTSKKSVFGRDIAAAFPELKKTSLRSGDERREWHFAGIRLLDQDGSR